MALVDVIIPVFNTPLVYVGEALQSLREQDLADWRAWIINDASAPGYTEELRDLIAKARDERMVYVFCTHKGPAGSRNVGIAEGRAPYIALLDSDDRWLPGHLARQVGHLRDSESYDLVHGHAQAIDGSGGMLPPAAPRRDLNHMSQVQLFVEMLLTNFVCASSVVGRRSAFELVGGFDASYPCLVDKELWLRMLNAGVRFLHDEQALFHYRVHAGNISSKTDLLLATRRRIIAQAGQLIGMNPEMASIDWPRIRRRMTAHMHSEAALAYSARGRHGDALRHSMPWTAGLGWNPLVVAARSVAHLLRNGARVRRGA